jgi:hypothetical protein
MEVKMVLSVKSLAGGSSNLNFGPDPDADNSSWTGSTGDASFYANVNSTVADTFTPGVKYTVTITETPA